jgi:hypothetical protein
MVRFGLSKNSLNNPNPASHNSNLQYGFIVER